MFALRSLLTRARRHWCGHGALNGGSGGHAACRWSTAGKAALPCDPGPGHRIQAGAFHVKGVLRRPRVAPLSWPIVPRVSAYAIDQILEDLGLNWWAVLGLNQ
jgi:hypothetical protein